MAILVLLRHGESLWNQLNLFTGWVDVPLTQKGIDEALDAGRMLKDINFDAIFVSTLMRAQQTAMLAMLEAAKDKTPCMIHEEALLHDKEKIYSPERLKKILPVYIDYRLNERHYGELQGKNKAETAEKYGQEQVKLWRRSYNVPPPSGESLEMTAKRTLPCFDERIMPLLETGKNVLVVAHGNSLRSIVMSIENLSKEAVLSLELPTGVPRSYKLRNSKLQAFSLSDTNSDNV